MFGKIFLKLYIEKSIYHIFVQLNNYWMWFT